MMLSVFKSFKDGSMFCNTAELGTNVLMKKHLRHCPDKHRHNHVYTQSTCGGGLSTKSCSSFIAVI